MTLLVAWLAFPLVLGLLALGCGLLLDSLSGRRLPAPLILPAGLAVVIAAAHFPALTDATAELTTPLVVSLAVAGLALSWPWRPLRVDPWPAGAAIAVYCVFAAPFVLSGEATFGGYIKLDDTASWLAMTARVIDHGPTFSSLAPSSYEATLDFYLGSHYPDGAFLPLGIGGKLVGEDIAWLYQPYLAFLAAMVALCLYAITSRLVKSPALRALTVFVASQPAILFGYTLWGGNKEQATAWTLALGAALVPLFLDDRARARSVLPLAVTTAATLAILGFGGAVWIAPVLLVALLGVIRLGGRDLALRATAAFAVLAAVLSLPALRTISFLSDPAASTITNRSRLANLIEPLSGFQLFGIWPVGDFRLRPDDLDVTYVLIAVLAVSALLGLFWAWRRGAWALLVYGFGAALGCLVVTTFGSPWVDAKALAIASPAFVLAGAAGAAVVFEGGRRVEAVVLAAAITGGVLWSNALAYQDVNLAPHDRFAELERIGDRIAGQGPTLMTEYEPFGVRYFLRAADPEGASELRRRLVPLRNGRPLDRAVPADIDEFNLNAILTYRTLVLRRSPLASRPPSPYNIVFRGRHYEVWQRPETLTSRIIDHLPLGGSKPQARPSCAEVHRLARRAGRDGVLAAVERSPEVVVPLSRAIHPPSWPNNRVDATRLDPDSEGSVEANVALPSAGRYGLWVGGSFRGRLEVVVDGSRLSDERHELSHFGHFLPLGNMRLAAGPHRVELRYGGADLHPGSGGQPFALGPLVASSQTAADTKITYVNSGRADSLCGKSLDWVEALSH
jgi:hypothetical protein